LDAPATPPSAAAPPRRRRRRLWIALVGLATLVVSGVVAVRVLTSPERIRAMVAARLGEVCRGDFTVRSARLRLLQGRLEIEGIEIRSADPALADPPAVKVESIRADISLWNLIFGGDVVGSVEASGVELNRIETADGRSNFSGLFAPTGRRRTRPSLP
jgi:uncharacterized protein involved in outer membrane biogenesis